MILREFFLAFTIFLTPLIYGQQFDLNNIKIDDMTTELVVAEPTPKAPFPEYKPL